MNEIETIFCKLLHCDRSRLYLDEKNLLLNAGNLHRLERILAKRIIGEPLQYLIGDTDFMGLTLGVRPGVFIPRPETEILVDTVLQHVSRFQGPRAPSITIFDIGTGSGNIAIALAKFLPHSQIVAIDISSEAISMARRNAVVHGVKNQIDFINNDFLNLERCPLRGGSTLFRTNVVPFGEAPLCFARTLGPFDMIVSNPPYIHAEDHPHLPFDVQQEPREALLAGQDGFHFYHLIEKQGRSLLCSGGRIFVEMGDGQSEELQNIFSDPHLWKNVRFVKDHNMIERVAVIERI